MSLLSKLTGVHIGLGPKKVNFAPPPEIASNPEALAAWQRTQGQVNGTIGNAQTMNKAALLAAGGLTGAGLLGYGPMAGGGAATAGGGATAGGVAQAGTAASTGSSLLGKLKGMASGAGTLLGKVNDATGGGSGIDKALLAAAIADAAANRQRQASLQDKGLAYATDSYSARQPLRHRGLELMQDESAPDLGSIFVNPKNPYNKTVPTPQFGSRVPTGAPVMPKGGMY